MRENLKSTEGQHNTVSENGDQDDGNIQTKVGSWWNDVFNTQKNNLTQKVSLKNEGNK